MGVSKNRGTPKSSILMVFSIINHPFWGTPIFGNTQISRNQRKQLIFFVIFPPLSFLVLRVDPIPTHVGSPAAGPEKRQCQMEEP